MAGTYSSLRSDSVTGSAGERRAAGVRPDLARSPKKRQSRCFGGAIGAKAEWITAGHPLDYGYGLGSPFAKLVEAGGKVLMVGAPLDTMTLLHHAEHLAAIPGKRIRRYEVPFLTADGTSWRMVEEFETSDPVAPGLDHDYFGTIVAAFLKNGGGVLGRVGDAPSTRVKSAEILQFGVEWLERQFRS